MKSFTIGDRVKYSVDYLRSAGIYKGPVASARGAVIEVRRLGSAVLITVQWDGSAEDIPKTVLSGYLTFEKETAIN